MTSPRDTERLHLRELDAGDASFILALVNDPSWLRHIGDKGVRDLDGARAYIANGPVASYARFGFGLWCVTLKSDATPIGMCGLIKRDTLPDVDIGYALLPQFCGRGLALEAARAVMDHAEHVARLPRVVAIVSPENAASIALLEKIGLRFERSLRMTPDGPDTSLYAHEFARADD